LNRLRRNRALKHNRVQLVDSTRHLRQASQHFRYFFQTSMHRRRALEIQPGARRFALNSKLARERFPGGRKKMNNSVGLVRVFLLRTPGKARRQTHFHFRINASRKTWIAPDLDLASPNFE
jgi:hypothetical protein